MGMQKNEYSSFNATYISVAGTRGLIKELENESNQMVSLFLLFQF
jgi:hypothetical protein